MLNKFRQHIESQFPRLAKERFLLACSGGIDSVVLAHLCKASGLDFTLAHCNFQLRDAESDADEAFVRQLAKTLHTSIFVTHFDTKNYMRQNKVTLQVAARELRYHWFTEIMKENRITTLVTGHQSDDDIETFLINLSRGTGIDGLTGIPSRTATINRPLLHFSRADISAYATTEEISWREDRSNADTKYIRNKIRHDIVPRLNELHPTFMKNFGLSQKFLKGTAEIAKNHIGDLRKTLFEIDGDSIRIKTEPLKALKPLSSYLYGLFKDYGFTEWNDLEQLLSAMSGKEVRSKTHRLIKDRHSLILSKIVDPNNKTYQIQENDLTITMPLSLVIKNVSALTETGKGTLYVDKETLKYPLTIRKWEKGDYFYPLGMRGKKKLSKFFKDEKIDVISKHNQWLLCSKNEIVWVIGKRADNRFKVTDDTKTILKIQWHI